MGMDLRKILRATTSKGFTLIEILITVALVSLVMFAAVVSLNGAFRVSFDNFSRKLAINLREARDRAYLNNRLVRLRVDLDKQQYVFEEAPPNFLVPKSSDQSLSQREKEDKEKAEEGIFQILKQINKDAEKMPRGIKLVEIILPRQRDPFKEGTVDVFFYNNGSADGAVFHFEDDDHDKQSLILHPVTGQSKVRPGFVNAEGK